MLITYGRLDTSELRGTTQADYLISVDADLQILDGKRCVFEEPSFPVLELARSLLRWLSEHGRARARSPVREPDRSDFAFESMSYEEVGAVTVRATQGGWIFGSVFEPSASSPVEWDAAERCVRSFVAQVSADLRELKLDPDEVIGR
jgi:hypothetical protein